MIQATWDPGRLLELSGVYWQTCTLHAAVKLDLFSLLGENRLSAEEIAESQGLNPRGVVMLLNALVAMGLLTKKRDLFVNTPEGRSLLSKNSPRYLGHIILHHHHLMDSWGHLADGVRSGKPVRSGAAVTSAAARESFLMGMFNLAMSLAPRIVPRVDLYGYSHLLDLGGGPGTYAIHFCRHNPQLSATVFDLPTTRPFAQKTIAQFGLSDRIRFMEGNYLQGEIRGTYDVAWLSHILHGEGPEDCREIIRKAVAALGSGGMILIHDFILEDTLDAPLFPALFALNMLLGTERGQAYCERQIRDMLQGAGVRNIRRIAIESPNDSGIIAGRVD